MNQEEKKELMGKYAKKLENAIKRGKIYKNNKFFLFYYISELLTTKAMSVLTHLIKKLKKC